MDAFELAAWYPNLGRKEEGILHKSFTGAIGEFHPAKNEAEILAMAVTMGGILSEVSSDDKECALCWASAGRQNAAVCKSPHCPGA